jgi:hypothetical protein
MSLEASLRQSDDCELEIVCHQGEYVACIASKLHG